MDTQGQTEGFYLLTFASKEFRVRCDAGKDRAKVEAFLALIDFNGPNGCWVWRGGKRRGEYAIFTHNYNREPAYRFSYRLFVGPIPQGHDIHHKIGKPTRCMGGLCCQFEHLQAVTPGQHLRLHGKKPTQEGKVRNRHRLLGLCRFGHKLTPYTFPDGHATKRCDICRAAARHKKYLEWRDANPPATTCKNGHPKTAEFGYDNGRQWICRECQRAAMLAYKDRHAAELAAKKATSRGHQRDWEACAKGHPFTPENTYNAPNGTRMCRTCRADRQRAHWHKKHPDAPFQPQKGKHSNPADSPVQ